MPLLKNIIIQKESEDNVKQWHLNREQYIAMVSAIAVILCAFTYISAEFLGNYLYEKRLHKIKSNIVKGRLFVFYYCLPKYYLKNFRHK